MTLDEAIQAATEAQNFGLVEHLKQLNPTNNKELAGMQVKLTAKLEKFEGEKTEDSQPVEVIHVDLN